MAVAEVLDALADKNRRNILLKLKEGKISSGDLAIALGITPQALSYHLAKLKKKKKSRLDLRDTRKELYLL